ncbi:hypothetical protein KAM346_44640 [Aeromonas caviae]|nr:hypothetical protein KAM346_44640 [Aeromonas caviae]GKR38200.1 hypothetical protein KAM471_39640 [Aeromonas caviae]
MAFSWVWPHAAQAAEIPAINLVTGISPFNVFLRNLMYSIRIYLS